MEIRRLVAYSDSLLDAQGGADFGPNGLQVEGNRPVRKIATGVSACVELFERAAAAGADALFVHHGLLWEFSGSKPLIGFHGRRIRSIIESGMHLVAYHLPLDRHADLGNNALAARRLGLESLEPFAEYKGSPVGWKGRFPKPIAVSDLSRRCVELFAREPLTFLFGPPSVKSVGIVSGGAQGEIYAAIDAELDAYVTGEVSEWVMNVAREAGIHFLACGHYATERLGIRALGEHLAERFELEHEFIDVPNPV